MGLGGIEILKWYAGAVMEAFRGAMSVVWMRLLQ